MKIQIATLLAVACTLSASGVAVADNTWAKYCAKGVTPPKDTAYACFAGRNPLFKKLSSSSRFNGRFSPDLRGLVLFAGSNTVNFSTIKLSTVSTSGNCIAYDIQTNGGRSLKDGILCPGGDTIWLPNM